MLRVREACRSSHRRLSLGGDFDGEVRPTLGEEPPSRDAGLQGTGAPLRGDKVLEFMMLATPGFAMGNEL